MPRHYRRLYPSRPRTKYSIEQTAWTVNPAPGATEYVSIVPPSDAQGMRKVKHLTVSLAFGASSPMYWAIIYVPQGYQVQNPSFPNNESVSGGTPFYPANQFIMDSGVLDSQAGPARIHCRQSRNLNSGDQIYILIGNTSDGSANKVFGHTSYAIAYT
uniref:Capsid protein n=1 Tax=unidentified TaxID=32644 RepID=A0A6G9W4C8_9ZZZZ|nr:capsid protein [unidentified]